MFGSNGSSTHEGLPTKPKPGSGQGDYSADTIRARAPWKGKDPYGHKQPGLDKHSPTDQRAKFIGEQPVGKQEAAPKGYERGRIAGPLVLVDGIAETWGLDKGQLALILGYEAHETDTLTRLMSGEIPIRDRDQKDRIKYLLAIYGLVDSVFRDATVARDWLSEKKAALGQKSPFEQMLGGSMEDLLTVKWLAQQLAGR